MWYALVSIIQRWLNNVLNRTDKVKAQATIYVKHPPNKARPGHLVILRLVM